MLFFFFFFFSSRRRHTRFSRDWSSDVCSSDLGRARQLRRASGRETNANGCLKDRRREQRQACEAEAVLQEKQAGDVPDLGCYGQRDCRTEVCDGGESGRTARRELAGL